jgi:putative solute:sodium symporter small subunit
MTSASDNLTSAQRAQLIAARRDHWRRTHRVTMLLLLAWFSATFCTVFFARELSALSLFGWPLSFYLAAQGAALLYLAIIGIYALAMERIDRRFARRLAEETP